MGTLAQIHRSYSLSLLLSAALRIFTHEPIFKTVLFPFFTRAFSQYWILQALSQNCVVFHGLFWAFTRMRFALSVSCRKSLFSKLDFWLERFCWFWGKKNSLTISAVFLADIERLYCVDTEKWYCVHNGALLSATVSRIDKIIGLFCRIASLL